jgi:uncharacterized repeat protein (TIGR03847 family)
MTKLEIDLNPVSHITSDAIGAPGQRVFYIQAWQAERPQPVTLIVEKIQLQSLAIGVEKLMADLEREKPGLSQALTDYESEIMRILPPVDPIFRAGEIGIGYDEATSQIRRMARWSLEVINRGRPICPQCQQPMEPEGHFCPKKNGHKH